ncbi:hypothetical protein [Pseudomonas sp. UMAB-40]|uniref:hypothetical protein n=1 Tax=Pseudomonas sp. UMAB-40 TaxID=1365407 RepID=UPI001C5A36D0
MLGLAVIALVIISNVSTVTRTFCLRFAGIAHVVILDVLATAGALLGFAIVALVIIANVSTITRTFRFRFASVALVVVLNILTTAPALTRLAIVTLVIVADVFATGVNVAAEHQHHCEY